MITFNKDQKKNDLGGGVTRKVLSYAKNIMICEMTFKKGSIGALHHHPHEQIGYVVSGSFEVSDGGKKTVIHAGDTYYESPNAEHGVVALEDSVLIDVFTPMRDEFVNK